MKQKNSELPIGDLIDAVGEIREDREELEKNEAKYLSQLKAYGLPTGVHSGDEYVVIISEKANREYSNEKVFKKLGKDVFLKVVKVVVSKLKEQIGLSEIDELTEGEPTVSKSYSFKKK